MEKNDIVIQQALLLDVDVGIPPEFDTDQKQVAYLPKPQPVDVEVGEDGQMWVTDNLDASIDAFGGDADSPSERAHIEELREAMDKASGVTPSAAGHIKAKVGNLSSENALRISLMGTIAKTKRKRVTYTAGIQALAELVLHALDTYGVYHTQPGDRKINISWPDALPPDESRRINDALAKLQLGIPPAVLRAELGYPDPAPPQSSASA